MSANGNVSTSMLNFTPRQTDNGKVLVCRATNELIKDEYKETTMKLNVCCKYTYAPIQVFSCVGLKCIVSYPYIVATSMIMMLGALRLYLGGLDI